jgi:hypothetical protein
MKSPAPRYPEPLQYQINHAGRFSRTLGVLRQEASVDDAAVLLWLEGRAQEVEVFAADVLRAWSSGELGTAAAARAIEEYLHELHGSMAGWYGQWYAPSCCGPLARTRDYPSGVRMQAHAGPPASAPRVPRADTLLDTVSDAPAADLTAHDRDPVRVALASVHALAPRPAPRRPARAV